MRWRIRRIRRLACFVLVTVVFGSNCYSQESELDQDLVQTLSAAIDTWQQQVEFSCHWELSETTAASREDAAAGRFRQPFEKISEGRYAKAGELVFSSIDYGHPPRKVGENTYTESSAVAVRSDQVTLRCPLRVEVPIGGFFRVRDYIKTKQSPVVGNSMPGGLNPLIPLGNERRPNLIKHYMDYKKSGKDVEIRVVRGGPEHLNVQIDHTTPDFKMAVELQFLMSPDIPVIDHATVSSSSPNEATRYLGQGFSDFVNVGGGLVAKKTWMYYTNHGSENNASYGVRFWQSDDLGDNPPQREDFLLRVPEGTKILCLKPESKPEPVDGVQTYDITELSLDDLSPDCLGEGETESLARFWWARWVGVLIAIGVAIYLAVVLWRKKGRIPAKK